MNFYYNFESIDILPLIEKYQGKGLEDLFSNYKVIKTEMGEFLEFIWQESSFPCNISLRKSKKELVRNLKTVYYIGEKTERKLVKRGVKTLYDLRINLKYRNSANSILNLIKRKDYIALYENSYINDLDVAFCFKLKDLLFLDIETMGTYSSPIIMIGLGYFNNGIFEIHILFARDFSEEIAMCEHLKHKVLSRFKCFVTYNGKSFDIPYLANRFLYYFDENPMIAQDDVPYKVNNTRLHHIDLYHNCRRKFKEMYDGFTLSEMEEKVLNFKRDMDIPGALVGFCYRKYLEDPLLHTGLIKKIIDHNYYDVYSMPLLLQKLLEK